MTTNNQTQRAGAGIAPHRLVVDWGGGDWACECGRIRCRVCADQLGLTTDMPVAVIGHPSETLPGERLVIGNEVFTVGETIQIRGVSPSRQARNTSGGDSAM